MTARFVSFTYYKAHTCTVEFGIVYAKVANVASYSLVFNEKGYGVQKLEEQPYGGSYAILKLGGVPGAANLNFWEVGAGSISEEKSKCTPTVSPYAAQYSKLHVTAVLK